MQSAADAMAATRAAAPFLPSQLTRAIGDLGIRSVADRFSSLRPCRLGPFTNDISREGEGGYLNF